MNTSMNGRILNANVHRRTQVIIVDLSQVLWSFILSSPWRVEGCGTRCRAQSLVLKRSNR